MMNLMELLAKGSSCMIYQIQLLSWPDAAKRSPCCCCQIHRTAADLTLLSPTYRLPLQCTESTIRKRIELLQNHKSVVRGHNSWVFGVSAADCGMLTAAQVALRMDDVLQLLELLRHEPVWYSRRKNWRRTWPSSLTKEKRFNARVTWKARSRR
jgi:hypothetical protein